MSTSMAFRCGSSLPRWWALKLSVLILTCALVSMLWFGMNSDQDNVPPFLQHIIPAGNCMCRTSTIFDCSSSLNELQSNNSELALPSSQSLEGNWTYSFPRDATNEALNDSQCDAAFPGLFEDIYRAASFWRDQGNMQSALDSTPLNDGMAAASIHNGRLYVRSTRCKNEDHRRKILAVLSSMNRALSGIPTSHAIPNTTFLFSVEDLIRDVASASAPIWALARKADEQAAWLIPDFGYWSWNHESTTIGPYDELASDITRLEEGEMAWDKKLPQLVWRGKLSFAPKLRHALLEAARGREWGAVKELSWETGGNVISIEDHCRYRFIAHVEGRSYSASLKYRQACRSVVVAHKLQFIQHHHYLLAASGPAQNYVEVERDFSNLPAKIEALLADPAEARRIADNSVGTFRERYLTRAAEACYWRRLFGVWGEFIDRSAEGNVGLGSWRGGERRRERFESFLLRESADMMRFDS